MKYVAFNLKKSDSTPAEPGMYVLQVRYTDGGSGTAVFVKE